MLSLIIALILSIQMCNMSLVCCVIDLARFFLGHENASIRLCRSLMDSVMLEGWVSDCAYAPYWMCTTRFMCHICRGTLQNFQLLTGGCPVASCPAQKCPGYARADGSAGYTRHLGIFNCISFGRSHLSMHQNTHSTTPRS